MDPVAEDLGSAAGLAGGLGRSRHLVDEDCRVRDSRHVLGCHLVRLEDHHRRAGLAGIAAAAVRIRTADAAVGLEDCREAAVEEEDSCTAGCQPSDWLQDERRPAAVQVLSTVGQVVGKG